MAWHNELGKWGEQIAAEYLEKKGLRVIDRDWRDGHRDIDIVAIDLDKHLNVFVEVKTRSNDSFGQPEEAVDLEKQNNILRASMAYASNNRMWNFERRYDTIYIIGTPENIQRFDHVEGAFDESSSYLYAQQKRKKNYYKRRYGLGR